eukprot:TRINITY_DN11515_c0_g2_i1.p1 TRINITY_DN11515_c0_g2~~TRINITY_DN11515_c0_g2_i1.p1  ORF type:complete len:345 (+),score=55.76 TRINITY_DN11515_c0_g2_i1:37-1035(+)
MAFIRRCLPQLFRKPLRPLQLAVASRCKATAARDWDGLRQQLDHDGFVIIRNVLDNTLVGELQSHVDYLTEKYPTIPTEHWHHCIMRNDAFWVRVCADHRLVEIAQELAPFLQRSPGVALFSSHYFNKLPRTGKAVLWHQDGSYWPLRPMDVITLWLAVDHSNRHNGCLKVVRGTHRSELQDLQEDRTGNNVLGSATHTDADINSDDIVHLELAPGDVSVHHPNIIHASDPNTSDTRRCGLTLRYMSSTTQCLEPTQPVMMMAGDKVAGVNEYRSWPKYRDGYDMPFQGSDAWNATRRTEAHDEPFFERTDYADIEDEIVAEVEAFVRELGG